jgi:hypothetical protein
VAENHHFWLNPASRTEFALVAAEYFQECIENKRLASLRYRLFGMAVANQLCRDIPAYSGL